MMYNTKTALSTIIRITVVNIYWALSIHQAYTVSNLIITEIQR